MRVHEKYITVCWKQSWSVLSPPMTAFGRAFGAQPCYLQYSRRAILGTKMQPRRSPAIAQVSVAALLLLTSERFKGSLGGWRREENGVLSTEVNRPPRLFSSRQIQGLCSRRQTQIYSFLPSAWWLDHRTCERTRALQVHRTQHYANESRHCHVCFVCTL